MKGKGSVKLGAGDLKKSNVFSGPFVGNIGIRIGKLGVHFYSSILYSLAGAIQSAAVAKSQLIV